MKFSHSLQFNAVPEWSNKYIAYSQLKKLIYALQTEQLYHGNEYTSSTKDNNNNNNNDEVSVDLEGTPLLQAQGKPLDVFVKALDKELNKIDKFYNVQEQLIFQNFDDLFADFQQYMFAMEHDEDNTNTNTNTNTNNNDINNNISNYGEDRNSNKARRRYSDLDHEDENEDENEDALVEPDNELHLQHYERNNNTNASIQKNGDSDLDEDDMDDEDDDIEYQHTRPRSSSSPTRRASNLFDHNVHDDQLVPPETEIHINNLKSTASMNSRGKKNGLSRDYSRKSAANNNKNNNNNTNHNNKAQGTFNKLISSVHDILSTPAISRARSNNDLSTMNDSSQLYLEHLISLKRRIISLFTHTNELKSYIELNYTGFSKICKKFDKSLEENLKQQYLQKIEQFHVFNKDTKKNIEGLINEILLMYSDVNHISFEDAESELNLHLREHVVWERNTVWKDMMNLERKVQSIKVNKSKHKHLQTKNNFNTPNAGHAGMNGTRYGSTGNGHAKVREPLTKKNSVGSITLAHQNDEQHKFYNSSDVSIVSGPPPSIKYFSDLKLLSAKDMLSMFLKSKLLKFIIICTIASMFFYTTPWFEDVQQRNCLVILVFSALLWGTETLPLFVTALVIPLLIVVLPVLKHDNTGEAFTPVESSQFILSTMWNSVIMLLLGGFTLAAALSKYNIAKIISTHILSKAGTNPKIILLTNMFVALFASMWVSNVAAPVLCYSIIQPLLRTLPKNCKYAKSLILGIALASNIGGMSSPIASPQNIMSIGMMNPTPSWTTWFIVAIPVSVLCILGIWVILLLSFPIEPTVKILKIHPVSDPFTVKQWYIVIVTCVTIVLWCLANTLKGIFGEMGIISILPIVALFGTGLLTSDDFNNFLWTIVVLAMGGTTLGKAVINSGLLVTIASQIKTMIEDQPIFVIVLLFGFIIITIATFVSHTVAAMIIAPLMKEIGENLPGKVKHSNLLVMLTALLCSGAMALPTSGFPNLCGISLVDDFGERYLTVGNFISRGVPATLWTYFILVTVGYGLMKFVGY